MLYLRMNHILIEGTLPGLSMANMALADLILIPHCFCLAKNY